MVMVIGMFLSCGNTDDDLTNLLSSNDDPDEISEGVTLLYSDMGIQQLKLEAPILYRYHEKQIIECPMGMRLTFYDSLGIVESSIQGLYGKMYSAEEYLYLRDSVVVQNRDNHRLETPELHVYLKQDSIVSTKRVKITTPDGEIRGKYLYTNSNFTRYEIDSIGDSYYYYKEETDAE
jgi:LPS export ABC transporter protein LptC